MRKLIILYCIISSSFCFRFFSNTYKQVIPCHKFINNRYFDLSLINKEFGYELSKVNTNGSSSFTDQRIITNHCNNISFPEQLCKRELTIAFLLRNKKECMTLSKEDPNKNSIERHHDKIVK